MNACKSYPHTLPSTTPAAAAQSANAGRPPPLLCRSFSLVENCPDQAPARSAVCVKARHAGTGRSTRLIGKRSAAHFGQASILLVKFADMYKAIGCYRKRDRSEERRV